MSSTHEPAQLLEPSNLLEPLDLRNTHATASIRRLARTEAQARNDSLGTPAGRVQESAGRLSNLS